MVKELKIISRIEDDGEVKTIVNKVGFPEGTDGIFEVIGILENIKQTQLNKLKIEKQESIDNNKDDNTVIFK